MESGAFEKKIKHPEKGNKHPEKEIRHRTGMRVTGICCALLLCLLAGILDGCGRAQDQTDEPAPAQTETAQEVPGAAGDTPEAEAEPEPEPEPEPEAEAAAEPEPEAEAEPDAEPAEETAAGGESLFKPEDLPAYSGDPYVAVNGNTPFFTEDDYTLRQFETYSKLDSLGRCGVAYANVCRDLMPLEERGDISQIHPSGWHNNPYDFIDGGYVYNRCHLIAFQLAGENANEKNLITGTRYMNTVGMMPFENMVADYVNETDGHVLYRVTPVFDGDNLVADGVLMEARSVEDRGAGIEFCVFCYNVQPGVTIDYATGHNKADGTLGGVEDPDDEEEMDYVLNTNSMKFHYPDCSAVEKMQAKNRKDYTGKRADIIDMGYEPCGICRP